MTTPIVPLSDEQYDDLLYDWDSETEAEQHLQDRVDRIREKGPLPAWLPVGSELREAA